MGTFLAVVGFLGCIICIIMAIISSIKKNGKAKKFSIGIIITLLLFVVGAAMMPKGSDNSTAQNNSSAATAANTSSTDSNKDAAAAAAPKADTKKAEAPKDESIKAGMYKVGADIKAGEYVVVASNDLGYMEVDKDSTGKLDSIIGNDNIEGRVYVTVNDGQYFNVKSAKIYPADKAPKVEAKNNKLAGGMYKVGVDLQPGEYKVSAKDEGYVEVKSDSNPGLDGIVSNDNFTGDKYVTVSAGQYIKLQSAELNLK